VISRVDSQLRREAREYHLRFTCEQCLHFDDQREVCSHGYPTKPHHSIRLDEVTELLFCKEFDLF
jgi:hypothetical protein